MGVLLLGLLGHGVPTTTLRPLFYTLKIRRDAHFLPRICNIYVCPCQCAYCVFLMYLLIHSRTVGRMPTVSIGTGWANGNSGTSGGRGVGGIRGGRLVARGDGRRRGKGSPLARYDSLWVAAGDTGRGWDL